MIALVAGFFVLWWGLGLGRFRGTARSASASAGGFLLVLAAPLAWFTVQEARVAAHLTFPFSLLLWPALGLLCLIVGGVLAAQDRWPVAWPLLGLPASLFLAWVGGSVLRLPL